MGPKEIIKKISRDEIKNFMASNYNPKKMVISAAGKVDHDSFVEQLKKKLNNLPNGKSDLPEKANFKSGEYREDKKLEQVHLMLGFEGIDYYHDDYYSLLVFSSLLIYIPKFYLSTA